MQANLWVVWISWGSLQRRGEREFQHCGGVVARFTTQSPRSSQRILSNYGIIHQACNNNAAWSGLPSHLGRKTDPPRFLSVQITYLVSRSGCSVLRSRKMIHRGQSHSVGLAVRHRQNIARPFGFSAAAAEVPKTGTETRTSWWAILQYRGGEEKNPNWRDIRLEWRALWYIQHYKTYPNRSNCLAKCIVSIL